MKTHVQVNKNWSVFPLAALVVAGLVASTPSSSDAQLLRNLFGSSYCCDDCYRGGYSSCDCYGQYAPGHDPSTMPPSDLPRSKDDMADDMVMPPAADQPLQDTFIPSTTSQASIGMGAETPMLGRADALNRRNMFDTMTAIPQNRMWIGYQHVDDFQSGGIFAATQTQELYRFGIEVLLSERFSFEVQGQYHSADFDSGAGTAFDDWESPHFIFKYAFRETDCSLTSLAVGFDPQISHGEPGTITEFTSRGTLALLHYRDRGQWFNQWGMAYSGGLDTDQIDSFDWALSVGYWMYRHWSIDPCARCCPEGCCDCVPFVVGLAPQFEVLGHHVIGSESITDPFGSSGIGLYTEPDDVIDMTVGGAVVFRNNTYLQVAYSFNPSRELARGNEFLVTYTLGF